VVVADLRKGRARGALPGSRLHPDQPISRTISIAQDYSLVHGGTIDRRFAAETLPGADGLPRATDGVPDWRRAADKPQMSRGQDDTCSVRDADLGEVSEGSQSARQAPEGRLPDPRNGPE
jgi:hypothetical protein